MFAGPNGSGKSTLINDSLNDPDNRGLLYIGPDSFFSLLYPNPPSDPEEYRQCYIESMQLSESFRRILVNKGTDFIFETVFSTIEKVEFLREAKDRGYMVSVNFVTTYDPEINIARVAQRVAEFGHDVPKDKIVARYYRSMNQLQYLFDIADELSIFDNSSRYCRLVYQHNESQYYLNPNFKHTSWVNKYVTPFLQNHL